MQNQDVTKSNWTGSVLGLLGVSLIMGLLSVFTLGIGVPWAITHYIRYITEHMTIHGRVFYFDGTGGQLFGNWIKWCLLSIITLGIYSFWVPNNIWRWIAKHVHISEMAQEPLGY